MKKSKQTLYFLGCLKQFYTQINIYISDHDFVSYTGGQLQRPLLGACTTSQIQPDSKKEIMKDTTPDMSDTVRSSTVSNHDEAENRTVRRKGSSSEEVPQEDNYPDTLLDITTSFQNVPAQQLFNEHSYAHPKPVEGTVSNHDEVENRTARRKDSSSEEVLQEDNYPDTLLDITTSFQNVPVQQLFNEHSYAHPKPVEGTGTGRPVLNRSEIPVGKVSTETHRIDLKKLNMNSETMSTSRKYIFRLKLIQKSPTTHPELEDLKIAWGGLTKDDSIKFLARITFKCHTEPKSNLSFQVVETNLMKNFYNRCPNRWKAFFGYTFLFSAICLQTQYKIVSRNS